MDKERADQLLASWNEMHAGANNAYKTALLTGGMEAKVMSINNDNAQWLQSRQFQRQEIASWFLLPANKLNDTASVSYASVAAYNKAYLDQTLMNWIVTLGGRTDRQAAHDKTTRRRSIQF
jgi:HK97 family phage portal protein